jgi:BirA family biotin operon repressor/biotin-[acetyl-CoA-carboxylase] ligase
MDRLDAALLGLPGVDTRVVEQCASTNSALLTEGPGAGPVLLAAEAQSAGRGRRGRRWHSTPGADLTFSLAVQVRRPARELAALSLVAGVAVSKALRDAGLAAVSLKWPNDLVVDGAKLGGILVETRRDGSRTRAVFGIGVNCRRSAQLEARARRRLAFVEDFIDPDRNALVRRIAAALLGALERFETHGFEPAEWDALHAHAGQRLRVRLADGRTLSGIASGLADDGALRLRNRRGLHAVRSGQVMNARPA